MEVVDIWDDQICLCRYDLKRTQRNVDDYLGKDRYITKFDSTMPWSDAETNMHVGVAVDGKYVKSGVFTSDYGPILMESDSIWACVGNVINAGCSIVVASGKIYKSNGLTVNSLVKVKSSPCQDIEMLQMVEKDRESPPLYNLELNSCINWSVKALLYGMQEPDVKKCCNPDKSKYEENNE